MQLHQEWRSLNPVIDLTVSESSRAWFESGSGPSAIVAAVAWIEQAMLGTVATTVAILVVSSIGLMMLNGRIPVRYGANIVLGCFILFGAPTIAAGIRSVAGDEGADVAAYRPESTPLPPLPPLPEAAPEPASDDPYAGATVPF